MHSQSLRNPIRSCSRDLRFSERSSPDETNSRSPSSYRRPELADIRQGADADRSPRHLKRSSRQDSLRHPAVSHVASERISMAPRRRPISQKKRDVGSAFMPLFYGRCFASPRRFSVSDCNRPATIVGIRCRNALWTNPRKKHSSAIGANVKEKSKSG